MDLYVRVINQLYLELQAKIRSEYRLITAVSNAPGRTEYLLDPHRHLPADLLLLLDGSIPLGQGRVVPVPAGSVSQCVPDSIEALLAQHFYETRDARLLYLFQGLEVWWRIPHR